MGWYRVVKTIKGHRYIYEQRTWREGKRVRTESRYIGAAVNTTLPDGRNPSAVVEEAFTDLMKPYPPQYHWTHGWASNPMREKPLEHIVEVDKFIAGLKLKRTSSTEAAYYKRNLDTINIPPEQNFYDIDHE